MITRKKTDLVGKLSVCFVCVPAGLTLIFALICLLFVEDSEFFSGEFFAFAIILLGIHLIAGTSLVGIILAVVALRRTRGESGKIGLILNLTFAIICTLSVVKLHADSISYLLSPEFKMHRAITKGDSKKVRRQLNNGAAVNFPNRKGLLPLQRAIKLKEREIIEVLLANGADVNASDRGGTALHYLTRENEPMSATSKWDGFQVAELLLELGANPNIVSDWPNKTPLLIAAEKGDEKMVDLLLAYGADINQKGIWTPGQTGNTALHYAAWKGNKQMALLLLNNGADVNAQGTNKGTPLHKAVENKQREIVALLLARGADVNARDSFGKTPLDKLPWDCPEEIKELLLINSTDVNALK